MSTKKKKKIKEKKQLTLPPQLQKKYENQDLMDQNDFPDEMKISAKFVELIEPWSDEADMSILTDCAAIAWDESLKDDFDIECYPSLKNAFLNFDNYRWLIDELIERKRLLFPKESRIIRETFIQYNNVGDMTINVISEIDSKTIDRAIKELADTLERMIKESDSLK